MADNPPLYNSRIIKIFIDYLHVNHPDIDVRDTLNSAGITAEEAADTAHWFTQQETDRWYEAIVEKTGDTDIARKAGRFSVSSEGLSHLKQYAAAFLSTETALMSLKNCMPSYPEQRPLKSPKSVSANLRSSQLPWKASRRNPINAKTGLAPLKPCPCFSPITFAQIEHVECYHNGAPACRYIISWQNPPSQKLRLISQLWPSGFLGWQLLAHFFYSL